MICDISLRFVFVHYSNNDNIRCLADKPLSPLEYQLKLASHVASEPGQAYNKNVQCEMVYGKGAKICPYMVSLLTICLSMDVNLHTNWFWAGNQCYIASHSVALELSVGALHDCRRSEQRSSK